MYIDIIDYSLFVFYKKHTIINLFFQNKTPTMNSLKLILLGISILSLSISCESAKSDKTETATIATTNNTSATTSTATTPSTTTTATATANPAKKTAANPAEKTTEKVAEAVKEEKTSKQEKKEVNTGKGAAFLTAREKEMVQEINLMRSDPAAYVKHINDYIAQVKEDEKNGTGFGNAAEEIATANELIAELKKVGTLSVLETHEGIHKAAIAHGKDGKSKGSLDHKGSDGSMPWDRVRKYAPDCKDGNENLVGGSPSVREAVILLLVDSGISNRGHRKTLLDKRWKYVSCHEVGKVGDMPYYWIQKFGF